MKNLINKVSDVQYHRNGIGGAPFYVVTFVAEEHRRMVAVVFEETSHVAVLDVDLLNANNIKFGMNSWRGDNFESELRAIIAKYEKDEQGE